MQTHIHTHHGAPFRVPLTYRCCVSAGGGFSFLALTTLALSGCDALAELPEYLPSLPLTRLC